MSAATLTSQIEMLDIVADDFEEINDAFYARGMTDGLPIVPPTRARVERMLSGSKRTVDEVLGLFPPSFDEATVGAVAVNAVMAGCRPEYLPVVLAAVEAMLEPEFNLYGINATTHPVTPLLVVSGPVVGRLGLNFGYNCFGQGNRGNATIGRAVRLTMINIGRGRPGEGDRATHGHPGKFSYCIAEDAVGNPWEPLHMQRGFAADESAVTVFGAEAPHEVNDHSSGSGAGVLDVIASTFATLGSNNAYFNNGELCAVMAPEHAERVARDGWSLAEVQAYLFNACRNSAASLRASGKYEKLVQRRFNEKDADAMVPMVARPEDICVFVAGGAGQHTMAIPSFGMTRSVTRRVGD